VSLDGALQVGAFVDFYLIDGFRGRLRGHAKMK
jgi:hypothetical protein